MNFGQGLFNTKLHYSISSTQILNSRSTFGPPMIASAESYNLREYRLC